MTPEIGTPPPIALPYRKDIDGLRFFAIVPVVLYHAIGKYVPSGFVGVDIFFVISGYLIGGIIYRESSNGKFSFLNFYARRVRRILPALLVVIVFTLLAGLLLLDTEEMSLLAGSAQWTMLGISNIFFFNQVDYFAQDASYNPLLMTWSLGIEEQFYVIFPIILLALGSLRRRYHLAGVLVLVTLSFAASIYCAAMYPLAGFYLLPARAWELGAGAALAIVHSQIPRERRWGTASDGLALVGLATILVSCWLFSEDTPFPGYAALLPVIGTLFLLHTADSRTNRNLLTARVFTWIGLVSYSWYLWHWPLMAFVRISANGAPTLAAMLVMAGLSLLFAYGSWRFVEQPLRRGTLPPPRILMGYGAVILCLLGTLQFLKHEHSFAEWRLPRKVVEIERIQHLSLAGDACMASFGDAELPRGPNCAPRGATVALFGDSHATHLRFGLRDYVESRGSHLLQLTKASCPPLLGFSREDRLNPTNLKECEQFQTRAMAQILGDPSIRTVILANFLDQTGSNSSFRREGSQFVEVPTESAVSIGTEAMVSALRKAGKHVVLVLEPPKYNVNISQTMIAAAIPARDSLGRLTSRSDKPIPDLAQTMSMRDLTKQSVRGIDGVTIIDLAEQFCVAGKCEYSSNGLPFYHDDDHLSIVGSKRIRWDQVPVTL